MNVVREECGQFSAALVAWELLLGSDQIIDSGEELARYSRNTTETQRSIRAVLKPIDRNVIPKILRIASQFKVPVYPISCGRNWGYGCAAPVCDGHIILDMSRLQNVELSSEELGVFTVEPGVSQRILSEYLEKNNLPFMVPVTGAGPEASILGNAIERGYGLTPTADHFAAITTIEVALADGSVYKSALDVAGAPLVDKCFKWGVGPYLDGIFTQSNLGVVMSVSLTLVRRPMRVVPFLFTIKEEGSFEGAVEAVRDILCQVGGMVSGINLINRRRMLSMLEPYPFDRVPEGEIMSDQIVSEISKVHKLGAWSGVGVIYGTPDVVHGVKKFIKRRVKTVSDRIVFLTPRVMKTLNWVSKIPGFSKRFSPLCQRLEAAVQNFSGRPSEVALPLAYWLNRSGLPDKPLNPSHNGSGLIWYSPLIPMKGESARDYVTMVEKICRKHGIEPAITFTSCSQQCFDSTLPILFERDSGEAAKRAQACYDELLESGRQLGYFPYRHGIGSMNKVVNDDAVCWRIVNAIKSTLDPQRVLAPGRYCPIASSEY